MQEQSQQTDKRGTDATRVSHGSHTEHASKLSLRPIRFCCEVNVFQLRRTLDYNFGRKDTTDAVHDLVFCYPSPQAANQTRNQFNILIPADSVKYMMMCNDLMCT